MRFGQAKLHRLNFLILVKELPADGACYRLQKSMGRALHDLLNVTVLRQNQSGLRANAAQVLRSRR